MSADSEVQQNPLNSLRREQIMRGFKNQVLSFKDNTKQLVCIYEDDTKQYALYLRTLRSDLKWEQRIMNRSKDFYHILCIAGEIARMQNMFEQTA